tara:strand:- start:6386 stop:7090 length:705 start_codon:yes stop_codon:yes gene_type:complete
MSSQSNIQSTLRAEAAAATMQERRAKQAAWLEREAHRRNGGVIAHSVKIELRAEAKGAVRSAEENGEWVTMTHQGKVAGASGRGKRLRKNPEKAKSSGNNARQASKFASLDLESDEETDTNITEVITPISNELLGEPVSSNSWASVAMTQLPTNHIAQNWQKVETSSSTPGSTKVSDFVAHAVVAATPSNTPINTPTNNDAWEDSDDETEPVIYTTPVKKSWADMMDESDEEDD